MTLAEKLSKQEFVLSMSSGYFGFFAHTGFVKAVLSEGLKPKTLTGASAGALVAACLASGMSIEDMEKEFLSIGRHHFWDPGFGFGVCKGDLFEKNLVRFVRPDMTALKYPTHISAFNLHKMKSEIFKEGPLPKIVRASCALPGLFQPVRIDRNLYLDGGIADKMGWNEIPSADIVLGHSLLGGGLTDANPFRKKGLGKNRHVLEMSGLPKTGPGYFQNGAKAIALAYEQTKRFLDS